MRLTDTGEFYNIAKERGTGVYATKKGSRWQYRSGDPKGKLVASGMTPASFVKSFWMRDDFEGDA